MGCGRVGATLALDIESRGHSVAVVDQNATSFRRLGAGFTGRRVKGIGFDRDTLIKARVEQAYAFAAVSNGDNSNILAARVARETFGVPHVVARIYDPRRAEIYQRLGIPTVATVQWTVDRVIRRLLPSGAVTELTDPSGEVAISEVSLHPAWIGRTVAHLEAVASTRVAYMSRLGTGLVPTGTTVVQQGDLVRVSHLIDDIDRIQAVLDAPPA